MESYFITSVVLVWKGHHEVFRTHAGGRRAGMAVTGAVTAASCQAVSAPSPAVKASSNCFHHIWILMCQFNNSPNKMSLHSPTTCCTLVSFPYYSTEWIPDAFLKKKSQLVFHFLSISLFITSKCFFHGKERKNLDWRPPTAPAWILETLRAISEGPLLTKTGAASTGLQL